MVIFQVDSTLHLLNNWPRMIFSSLLSTVIQNFLRRQKRQQRNRLTRQNNNFARAAHFFVHFFTVTGRLQFYVLKWTQTSQDQIFFLFLTLGIAVRNSAPEEFAFIWQSKQVGIIVIEIQRTQIHFLSDVFVAFFFTVCHLHTHEQFPQKQQELDYWSGLYQHTNAPGLPGGPGFPGKPRGPWNKISKY